jgi:Acetyltransferase (GNAT) domain
MSFSMQILDPIRYPSWDKMLLRAPGASFFHSSAWAKVLSESYGYTPQYFTVIEEGRLRSLVPVMEVNSHLTGKRGVSLPFTDYCAPILDGDISFQELFDQIIEFGQARGWKYVELRGAHAPSPMTPCLISYLGHTLDLTKGEKALYSGLRDSTRRNIRKAEKEKVEVRIEKTGDALREFCRLNRVTRREHGLPPQPYHFFEKVLRHIISKENGFIALAYFQGEAVAGNVYFHFGDRAIYKYGASDKAFQYLRANNLVMWEAIKWFADKGFKSFCFGRTELENEGLRQFKAGWGAEETQVQYFKYDLRRGSFIPGKKKGEPAYASLFRTMPMPVLNLIGSAFYRHMG